MAAKRTRKDQINGIYAYTDTDKFFAASLMKAHNHLCKQLNIDVPLYYERKHIFGPAAPFYGTFSPTKNECRFNFATNYGRTLYKAIETIGHELRHAIQFKEGWYAGHTETRSMVDGKRTKILIGDYKGVHYAGDYINAPWEIDARGFQQLYRDMCLGLFTEKELATVLPKFVPKPNNVRNFSK